MIIVKKETTKSIEMEKRRKGESEAITSRSIDPIRGEGPFLETDRGAARVGIGASAHVSAIIGVSWDGHVIRFYRFYPRFELAARFAYGKRKGFAFEGFLLSSENRTKRTCVSRFRGEGETSSSPSPTVSFARGWKMEKSFVSNAYFMKNSPSLSLRKELGANWNLRILDEISSFLALTQKLYLRDVVIDEVRIFRLNEFRWQFMPIGMYNLSWNSRSIIEERWVFSRLLQVGLLFLNGWSYHHCSPSKLTVLTALVNARSSQLRCNQRKIDIFLRRDHMYVYIYRITNEEPFTR